MKHMVLAVVTVWCVSQAPAAPPIETRGDLEAVTVYRDQALVTRRVEVGQTAGLREVVVTQLPERVVPASLYAEAVGDGLAVRSVRYRTRPVEADVRDEVRVLDQQIEQVQDRIRSLDQQIQVIQQQQAYLDKLATFTAATADTELTRGVLDANTLTTLTQYQFEQRETLAKRLLEIELQKRELGKQHNLLRRQRGELANSSATTVREALVFVDVEEGGGELRVRYLVDDAGWSPSYNVRADAQRSQVTVEYYASVRQMSGEDWSDVTMTLSTATPSLAAEAPALEPMTLTLTRETSQASAPQPTISYDALRMSNTQQRLELERQRGQKLAAAGETPSRRDGDGAFHAPAGPAPTDDYNQRLNWLASDLQLLEMRQAAGGLDASAAVRAPVQETVSVTYRVAQRTSLPSRSDQQLIQIASLPMEGEFYRVATPVLTPHVYEEASVKNSSDRVLLAGPVSAYTAGQFVGRGSIPTVAIGEPFTVGFGIDPSLRAQRELVDKDEAIRGGNRVMTFDYRLMVQNFGSEPVTLRLKDRIPTEGEGDQFNVDLVETRPALSDAADYLAQQRDRGILRWDIEVPAGATGVDASAVSYRYTIAHDRQLTISELPKRK